jgi:Zn-dependent peptidase ImmA (M78 family)
MVKIHYTGSKDDAQPFIDRIQAVIKKLPYDIQRSIHIGCMIIIIDTCYGYFIGKSQYNIIMLNIAQLRNDQLSEQDQEYIIAHEFAHYILDHKESTLKEEREVHELVGHWGFSKDL